MQLNDFLNKYEQAYGIISGGHMLRLIVDGDTNKPCLYFELEKAEEKYEQYVNNPIRFFRDTIVAEELKRKIEPQISDYLTIVKGNSYDLLNKYPPIITVYAIVSCDVFTHGKPRIRVSPMDDVPISYETQEEAAADYERQQKAWGYAYRGSGSKHVAETGGPDFICREIWGDDYIAMVSGKKEELIKKWGHSDATE